MKNMNEKPSNMGGSRNGRVLKEIKTPLSLPMVGGGAPPPHNNRNTQNQPNNRGNSNNNNVRPILSADSNLSSDVLKRRIRELEYENEQLKNHVSQAEKSIQNYRGFLSNKSTDRDTTRTIAVQTEDKSNSFENRYSNNNRMSGLSIASSFNNNTSVQNSVELMGARKERDELRTSLESLSSKYRIQENEFLLLKEEITRSSMNTKSIETIDILPQSESVPLPLPKVDEVDGIETPPEEFSPLISIRKHNLLGLYREIQKYRVEMKAMKSAFESELNSFKLAFQHEFTVKTLKCLSNMEQCGQKELDIYKNNLISASVMTSPMTKSQPEIAFSVCATSPIPAPVVCSESVATMTSPEKPLVMNATIDAIMSPNCNVMDNISTNRPTTPLHMPTSQSILKLPKLKHSAVESSPEPTPLVVQSGTDRNPQDITRILELECELRQQKDMQQQQYDTILREYDIKISNLMDQIIVEREKSNISTANLGRAKEYFNNNYLIKSKTEIEAIKRSAHVKDLMKVAAHREVSLEKDRMMNELVYKNELLDILTFAVTTTEQTLNELQPEVVVKLVEGRKKRLKQCGKQFNNRKKDLEQRSVETCLVSSTALDGFKVKAEKNLILAESELKKVLVVLNDLLTAPELK